MLKKIFFAAVSFIGWILSPFTWWNDAFVNLPIAYLSANIINRLFANSFLSVFLVSYWLTNILGIVLMYVGASGLSPKGLLKNSFRAVLIAIIVYSVISAFLIWVKVIKPF